MVSVDTMFRDVLASRLKEDLVGPLTEQEVLRDRPSQRYSTGILYPLDSFIEADEDQDHDLAVNESEDSVSEPDTSGVPLYAALKPSVAGLSFAVKPENSELCPSAEFRIRCATYENFEIDDDQKDTKATSRRSNELWRRVPHQAVVRVELFAGEQRVDLGTKGLDGLELYVLVIPHSNLLTVTAALSNKRIRGKTKSYDETQHFFQVEFSVGGLTNSEFAHRPSRRAELDEDSRSAALIYRDVTEYVVGHTCSARAGFSEENDGKLNYIGTEWIPSVTVPSISDQGDKVFNALRECEDSRPLEASWLAEADQKDLVRGLERLVDAYRQWINKEEERIKKLPERLHLQARKHLALCGQGAERMEEGITSIRDDVEICSAFQLSQKAMNLQFGWLRGESKLVWRPFQLGFQLLVLASLADRTHSHRGVMDLLWFPTGGGKTEAYLALTAFIILLRRLKETEKNEGAGVAVLMRYTLRLLTIQQFQRAAAMILACELLRRQSRSGQFDIPNLGNTPIGIGLWVGSTATPNKLQEALGRNDDSPSTHRQITSCPACSQRLEWKVTPRKSSVRCTSKPSKCDLAGSGGDLPIWTIDEEIYRHSPALVIGTVDKFAQIVRNMDTKSLFGGVGDFAPPDLIIQDELHLISGPLGSIAGLYEVAVDELCRRDLVRPKIIGSTATIRRAEDQIQALFDRKTYQFPSPGLDADNSGFAVVDQARPGRLYLGVTTAGRSATYMLQALAASLLQSASDCRASSEERNYYWTQIVYFNSLRELGHALVLMQDDVPFSIRQLGGRREESPRKIGPPAELTSRVRSYEIRDMLDRLEIDANQSEAVDLLLASNMISVGMDISRLGLMVVNTQPKTLSEYIQATSRVGRGEVPGLIITMYNNMRARDRAHYETFETWHRSLYRDIEATSVTPFASRAQDKALHAVLVALVRHKVREMDRRPVLDDIRRPQVEQLASLIEQRVARVDSGESLAVSKKLKYLIDQWASHPDLQTYWNDYGSKTSLLMSAEQFAAKADIDPDQESEGVRRALWPTPNSMRDVEAGTPFLLRPGLRAQER